MALRDLQPGDPATLGPYRLTGRLGSGGMGVVYLGFDPAGTAVAVKTVRPDAVADARVRMRREAECMAAISSPRVAPLLAADTEAASPWLATAYVAGESLAEAATPLSDTALHALASGLAQALAALEQAGITHRDVKPGNVILRHDGPVLVDLGISRGDDATALTEAGSTLGSPGWMPPEQLRGQPAGPPADVWGWGAVLVYAATGRPPFGDGPVEAVGWRILSADPDLTGVPAWLTPAVRAALAKNPAARPRAQALAHPPAASGSTALLPAAGAPALTAVVPPAAPGRNRLLPWMAAAAVVMALGLLLTLVLNGDSSKTAQPSGQSSEEATVATPSPAARSVAPTPRSPSPSVTSGTSLPRVRVSPTSPPTGPVERVKLVGSVGPWPLSAAAVRVGTPPVFPGEVPGWRRWVGSPPYANVLKGSGWLQVSSGGENRPCGAFVYFVRWESSSGIPLHSGAIHKVTGRLAASAGPSRRGWIVVNECYSPAFRAPAGKQGRFEVIEESSGWVHESWRNP